MSKIELSIREAIKNKDYVRALHLALMIPEIIVGIEYPDFDSISKYELFFDRYLKDYYSSSWDRMGFITGKDFFALKSEFTKNYDGNTDISENPNAETLSYISFTHDISRGMHCNKGGNVLQLNTFVFCDQLIFGLNEWLKVSFRNDELEQYLNIMEMDNIPESNHVFISYSRKDEDFVKKLSIDLKLSGVKPFVDIWEIKVGDSIAGKIMEGMKNCKYFIPVFSENFFLASNWPEIELNNALMLQGEKEEKFILPLVIEHVELPMLLKHIKYANFKSNYNVGLRDLLMSIK